MPGTPDLRPLTILAFDFGLRRIGVAAGQQVTGSATPLTVVAVSDTGPDWLAIQRLIEEWRPGQLLVGLPFHADGSEADMSQAARKFAKELERFGIPMALVDERFSSMEAEALFKALRQSGLRGRMQKGDIDAISAAVIAERWLAANAPGAS